MKRVKSGETATFYAEGMEPGRIGEVDFRIESKNGAVVVPAALATAEPDPGVYSIDIEVPTVESKTSYIVISSDSDLDLIGYEELEVLPPGGVLDDNIVGFAPSIAQVASLLRARTKKRGTGEELGTFTSDTMPTDDEAAQAIIEASREVTATVGTDIPDSTGPDSDALRKSVGGLIALLAAMNIESSFYPEQIERNHSNYNALERRFNSAIKRIADAVEAAGGDTSGDMGPGGNLKAAFNFGDHEPLEMDRPL